MLWPDPRSGSRLPWWGHTVASFGWLLTTVACDPTPPDAPAFDSKPRLDDPGELPDLSEFVAACEAATELGTTPQLWGDLGEADVVSAGPCELAGPVQVFRVVASADGLHRFGPSSTAFMPRMAVFSGSCAQRRLIGCSTGEAVESELLPAGTPLYVAVGALEGEGFKPSEDEVSFRVDHHFEGLLRLGDACYPWSTQNCPAGSACLDGDGQPLAVNGQGHCTIIEGSRCAFARHVEISAGQAVEVEFAEMPGLSARRSFGEAAPGDEHQHSCMPDPGQDWVLRIEPTPALLESLLKQDGSEIKLSIIGDPPGVGFALRGPHCAPNDEFVCVPPDPEGLRPPGFSMDARRAFAQGAQPYLFVEVPPPGGPAKLLVSIHTKSSSR